MSGLQLFLFAQVNDILPVILIFAVVILAIVAFTWHRSRSQSMLEQWAKENGLRILSSERRFWRRGPYFWGTSKGQDVYYVVVEDAAGQTRSGYVRVGSWILGMLSYNARVVWDDES